MSLTKVLNSFFNVIRDFKNRLIIITTIISVREVLNIINYIESILQFKYFELLYNYEKENIYYFG